MELYEEVKKEMVEVDGHKFEASYINKKNGDKVYIPVIFNKKTNQLIVPKCYKHNESILVDMKNDGTLLVDIEDFPGGE